MRVWTGLIIIAVTGAVATAGAIAWGQAPATAPAAQKTTTAAPAVSANKGEFGAVITREQLEGMKLSRTIDPAPKNQPLVFLDSAVGLHLNKTSYAENEPIRTWLVARYDAAETRRASARMVLGDAATGTTSTLENARIELVKQGETPTVIGGVGTNNGTPARTNIFFPPDSFWVTSGDLRTIVKGKLEPGRYTAKFWFDGLLATREFEIKAGTIEVPKAEVKKAAGRRMLVEVYGGWQGGGNNAAIIRRRAVANDKDVAPNNQNMVKMRMAEAYPNPRGFNDFQTGLGFGVGVGKSAKWYSTIDAIPANDGVAEITSEFQPNKGQNGGDRLIIRVTPVGNAAKENWLINSYASISLMLEWDQAGGRNIDQPSYNYGQGHVPVRFDRALEYTVDLNAQWRNNLSQMGMGQDVKKAGKITVLFASSPVRSATVQQGNEQWQLQQINQQNQQLKAIATGDAKLWQGVLKAEAMTLPADDGKGAGGAGAVPGVGIQLRE